MWNLMKFLKKSINFAYRPREVGQGSESTQTYFFGVYVSLRSKWVLYQPHTTISDDFLFSWSSTIFHGFPGNRIFDDFQNHDIAEGKLLKQDKLIFGEFFPLELFIWFLRRENLGFWVPNINKIHFTRIWHQRYRIFWGFLES